MGWAGRPVWIYPAPVWIYPAPVWIYPVYVWIYPASVWIYPVPVWIYPDVFASILTCLDLPCVKICFPCLDLPCAVWIYPDVFGFAPHPPGNHLGPVGNHVETNHVESNWKPLGNHMEPLGNHMETAWRRRRSILAVVPANLCVQCMDAAHIL